MQNRDFKKSILKMQKRFTKTKIDVHDIQQIRQELLAKASEHVIAFVKLRGEMPSPSDPDLDTKLNSEDLKEKYRQFKFHFNKIKEYSAKINYLMSDIYSLIDKSEEIMIKGVVHGYGDISKNIKNVK